MKKFLSMVMAAAMVVSLVPATAFAASDNVKATAKVVDAENYTETEVNSNHGAVSGPELQLTFTTADYTSAAASAEITLSFDNATLPATMQNIAQWQGKVFLNDGDVNEALDASNKFGSIKDIDTNTPALAITDFDLNSNGLLEEVTFELTGKMTRGWVLSFDLSSTMDKYSKGKTATVTVDSSDMKITNGDDLVYASVEAKGIEASTRKLTDIATEEYATVEDIKIKPAVGDNFAALVGDKTGTELTLRLNSGFEFVVDGTTTLKAGGADITNWKTNNRITIEDDEITFDLEHLTEVKTNVNEWTIEGLGVEATSAKADSTAVVKVGLTGCDTVSVEVAKVVSYTVAMTVDEDDDVPVIYSGVNVKNDGITDDSDHKSLEVTLKETFEGAWNNSKDFTLSVPEGVYITNADVSGYVAGPTNGAASGEAWFADAYDEGSYVDLTFKRRTWAETEPNQGQDKTEINFTLELVADPNFEGDVVLKLTGDAVEEQEVTIAKFVKPYTVEAQQNDMQIDYRNTEIPTSVVIKEAEAGLWEKDAKFVLSLDKIDFDDEGTITVDDKSGLEVKDDEVKGIKVGDNDGVYFVVDSRSDDEPATVTISGMQLYMQRSLPAGAYDLELVVTGKNDNRVDGSSDALFNTAYENQVVIAGSTTNKNDDGSDRTVADINDDFVSYTAKAGFVNIITAGREDTESFTTKVVVPVGESYLISGENKVTIDVPAYINANGYTMLPLRAVAVALGINSNNVLWDQSTRTATIMYGSKIINMTYGQKVVYVNGAMIPATAAVEITND
ncbi:stalk domain-containing protein, partial [Anaerotignum lactatifermentans]|uniref:stalk domain-containing protein n=1 Tax=Anaerotignum lactatifermentans TaxID=160404 RepID=UPI0027BA6291